MSPAVAKLGQLDHFHRRSQRPRLGPRDWLGANRVTRIWNIKKHRFRSTNSNTTSCILHYCHEVRERKKVHWDPWLSWKRLRPWHVRWFRWSRKRTQPLFLHSSANQRALWEWKQKIQSNQCCGSASKTQKSCNPRWIRVNSKNSGSRFT